MLLPDPPPRQRQECHVCSVDRLDLQGVQKYCKSPKLLEIEKLRNSEKNEQFTIIQ